MINRETKASNELTTVVQQVNRTKPSEPQSFQASNSDLMILYNNKSSKLKPSFINDAYGSRGSLILRAALGADNRKQQLKLKQSSKMQQVKLLNIKKRLSPKNRVLFADPVVSKKFEYEPTMLLNDTQPTVSQFQETPKESASESCLTDSHKDNVNTIKAVSDRDSTVKAVEQNNNNNNYLVYSQRRYHKRTLKRKRPIDPEVSCVKVACSQSRAENRFNKNDDDDNCLFSSPKIAKIAPYYHDQLEKLAQDLKDARKEAKDESSKLNPQGSEINNREKEILPAEVVTKIEVAKPIPQSNQRSQDYCKIGGFASFFNSFDPTRIGQWFYQLVSPNYSNHNFEFVN